MPSTTSPLNRAVSRMFRARMGVQRISGKRLAEQIGASQNYLAKRLRDEAAFTLDDVARVSEALGLDPAEVMGEAYEASRADEETGALP